MPVRCPQCGRFATYDAYLAKWVCRACEHVVLNPPRSEWTPEGSRKTRAAIRAALAETEKP